MKLKEVNDLPYAVLRAIETQAKVYSDSVGYHLKEAGEFDIQLSVTTLNKSPRQNHLYRRHSHEMVVDPWDRLHLLDGSIFHYILESHPQPGAWVEKRFGVMLKWEGKRIYLHGASDLFIPATGHLIDFKRASVNKLFYGDDEDYAFQLNILRWIILRQKSHTYEVKRLSNFYSFKDWRRSEMVRNPDYPKKPMLYKDHPIWSEDKIKSVLFEKIKKHCAASTLPDNQLPYCTDEEKWQRNKHRVIGKKKDGEWSKSSKGTYSTLDEANDKGKELGEYKLEFIPGFPRKCVQFCDCAIFCNQRQEEIRLAQQNQEEQQDDEY